MFITGICTGMRRCAFVFRITRVHSVLRGGPSSKVCINYHCKWVYDAHVIV